MVNCIAVSFVQAHLLIKYAGIKIKSHFEFDCLVHFFINFDLLSTLYAVMFIKNNYRDGSDNYKILIPIHTSYGAYDSNHNLVIFVGIKCTLRWHDDTF